jgi:DNA-binding HxlR family transcriptional regulator
MTYHHSNRLIAHWPEATDKLTLGGRFVGVIIAQHLNEQTNSYPISSATITRYTGLSRSTIDKAVSQLEALGLFSVVRASQRKPRAFQLLIECPAECDRLEIHNTKTELEVLKRRPPKRDNPTLDNQLRLNNASELPENNASELPNLSATNRELNKQLIKIDDYEEFFKETLVSKKEQTNLLDKYPLELSQLIKTLKELEQEQLIVRDHDLLKRAFTDEPERVLGQAQAIAAKGQDPRSYLRGAIRKYPLSLIPKEKAQELLTLRITSSNSKRLKEQPEDTTENWKEAYENQGLMWQQFSSSPEHIERVRHQYETIRENNSDLVPWDFIWGSGPDYAAFMVRTQSHQQLSITAARIASEAAELGVDLTRAKTVTQAIEALEAQTPAVQKLSIETP